jgi:hypothetical protein
MACIVDTPPSTATGPGYAAGEAVASVVVIDSAGTLYRLQMPHSAARAGVAGASRSRGGSNESIFVGLSSSDVLAVGDSPALVPLEGPTSIAAVGARLVAVGGMSGRVAILDVETLTPVAELKPATLARLWNSIAGARGGQHAIRCLRPVPRGSAPGAPLLLAALRADCYLQVWQWDLILIL